MTDKTECEIFIAIDDDGNFQVGIDAEEASDRLKADANPYAIRTISLLVKILPAQIETGPTIDIPDSAGTTQHIEVEAAQ